MRFLLLMLEVVELNRLLLELGVLMLGLMLLLVGLGKLVCLVVFGRLMLLMLGLLFVFKWFKKGFKWAYGVDIWGMVLGG